MTDIVAFLNARLDEDERHAKQAAAAGHRANPRHKWIVEEWRSDNPSAVPTASYVNDEHEMGVAVVNGSYAADHIARHDPARVLRDVAAKRRVLSEVIPEFLSCEATVRNEFDVGSTSDEMWHEGSNMLLRLMAAPYADHPDYDPTWDLASG
jgi:hypothetical protein